MKGRTKEERRRFTLNAYMVLVIFCIMFSSGTLSLGVAYLLYSFRIISDVMQAPLVGTIILFLISLCIGTTLSVLVGRRVLRPVNRIIAAQKEVAKGDFTVSVEYGGNHGELKELVDSFNEMVKELNGIELFRKDFINSFSHEFKTPMVSIQGFARQLQRKSLSEEERREYTEIIVEESRRLTNLASNILLLTKFENQQIVTEKAPFELDEQIRRCILLLEKQWERKGISFSLDLDPITFLGNKEMLSQVWLNVLGNAIKFSPAAPESTAGRGTGRPEATGCEIRVSAKRKDGFVTVEITDQGEGMDERTIQHIFERFYQGDRARASDGNGLGLPLVRRIVELCRGDIRVESMPGKGTAFRIRLPIE